MSEIYNAEYYKQYDVGIGKVDYSDSEYTKGFLTKIAQKIVDDLHPKTVLDAGCAMGHLVAALRDLGVEAYGVDISEYAVSRARADIRQFCKTGSLADEFPAGLPKHYDLVVSIEVLEHLYEENGKKAIHNLCKLSDQVLFSSTPDDFAERTHVNVQQREYWARLFFENGFVDDINYRPKYLTAHAVLFRKNENMVRQIEDYERNVRLSEHERQQAEANWSKAVEDKERHIQKITAERETERAAWNAKEVALHHDAKCMKEKLCRAEEEYHRQLSEQQNAALQDRQKLEKQAETEITSARKELKASQAECEAQNKTLEKLQGELSHYKEYYFAAINQREELKAQLANAQNAYNVISNAFFWKITKPLRVCLDTLKRIFGRVAFLRLLDKGVRCLNEHGLGYTINKYKLWRKAQTHAHNAPIEAGTPHDAAELVQDIKISVVVPLYNTPKKFLIEMIRSLKDQTYSNWELCLADASDDEHSYVEIVCKDFAIADSRIKYCKLIKNEGIAENTNQAIEMATGDYIGFLDHDDLIMTDAIYANVKAIQSTNADVLYSDEDHLSVDGRHIFPFYKPDWSPDLLYCQMYVCHFMVVRKSFLEAVGKLCSDFNGSQDYDLLLRLSEQTDRICHIPKILYSWRESENSTASNAGSKPYADDAGKRALDRHLKRTYGELSYAESTDYTFVYNARFALPQNIKVSIIVPMKDKWELSNQCVRSILSKSSYTNYEILILNNRSEEKQTEQWFKQIQDFDSRVQVLDADMEFNWSKLNNYGVAHANGDVFIFLNNDTLVISEDWIERLAENALRKDIGIVGGLLLYPDDTIQHAGVVVGMGGWADHVFKGMKPVHFGSPFVSPVISRNVLAVTGACMAISREKWNQLGVFDEEFIICGSDVELCVRAYNKGYYNRYDANVKLYHMESKSRDSYIPEIDFKKSDIMYAPYREDGDPFYNVNLSKESVEPKELSAPMPNMNFKNFLKKCPVIVSTYHAVKRKIVRPAESSIPEIGEFHPIATELPFGKRLNLIVPSVDKQHVFGGIATALKIFESICNEMNCAARIITTDADVQLATAVLSEKYHLVKNNEKSAERFQVTAYSDRATADILIAKEDYFVATAWWTAYIARDVIHWQARTYFSGLSPLIYIIQDFEPGFYAWSSRYMMAESTYHLDVPTYAIVNSSELSVFLQNKHYRFHRNWVFDPVLNEGLKVHLPGNLRKIPKKKQIIVYGRPSVERNAFGILVLSLMNWSSLQEDADEWLIYSLGEEHDDIELRPGVILRSMGKLSLEEYAQFLTDTYAGVSLMVSPHPSYPPLEMAAFGIKTITNTYENKEWKNFSSNITALQNCTPDSIAKALKELCNQYNGTGESDVPEAYISSENSFSVLAQSVVKTLNQYLGGAEI